MTELTQANVIVNRVDGRNHSENDLLSKPQSSDRRPSIRGIHRTAIFLGFSGMTSIVPVFFLSRMKASATGCRIFSSIHGKDDRHVEGSCRARTQAPGQTRPAPS